MPDFASPSDVMWSNPYLMPAPQPDKLSVLSNMLIGLGAGMNQATGMGRSAWAGLGPGAMYASQMNAQQQQQLEREQEKKQALALQWMGFQDKIQERERKRKALEMFATSGLSDGPQAGGPPGFAVQPPPAVTLGPGDFSTRTASLEGGTKNGGMVYNELGSGAFGPYQFMPGTWADVRNSNPGLNLPADMTQATAQQHKAAFDAFSAGNAKALQSAGIAPTPENLYLAHRFGAGGATAMLKANPNAMLADVLPIEWQKQNPDMRGQTVGGFQRLAAERMKGVGVPYQANGETTQYSLAPDSMEPGVDGTPVMAMRTIATPMAPTPVPGMPPQMPAATPAAPNPVLPVGGSGVPQAGAALSIPQPPMVPKPMLPPQEAARIQKLVMSEVLTPEQGLAERNRIINDLWTVQKDYANKQYEQQLNEYTHRRGLNDTYTPVWDAQKGQMVLVPKAQMGNYLPPEELQRQQKERELAASEKAQAQKAINDPVIMGADGSPVVNPTVPRAAADKTRAERDAAIEAETATAVVKDALKQFIDKDRPKGLAIQETLPQLHNIRRLVEQGAITGTGTEVRNTLAQLASTVGFKSTEATITPAYLAALADQITANAKALGVNPTDRDAAIIKEARGANPSNSKEAVLKLLDVQEELQRRAHDRYIQEAKRVSGMRGVKQAFGEDYFMLPAPPTYDEWKKANPTPDATGSVGQPAPTTASIPPAAIKHLQMNPRLKDEFDLKYGAGAADRVLKGK